MEWIRISEQLPKDGEFVLVSNGERYGYVTWQTETEDFEDRYVSGIPDHESHSFCNRDIIYWCCFPNLLGDLNAKKKDS